MEVVIPAIVLALFVAALVLQPLFRPASPEDPSSDERADLEAAKEAKYREIRDAELDHQMGKLSREDWRSVDRDLRREAIEILRQLDRLEGRTPDGGMDR